MVLKTIAKFNFSAEGYMGDVKLSKSEVKDQLSLWSLTYDGNSKPINIFNHNPMLPNFPFILGFVLGDGSLSIRIRLAQSSIWFIPVLQLPQKTLDSNIHFFDVLNCYFKTLNVTSSLVKNVQGVATLTVDGNSNMLLILLPYFK